MADIDKTHAVSLAYHLRDEIAVHMIEIGKGEKRFAPERFQPASGIFRRVTQQPAPDAIADA